MQKSILARLGNLEKNVTAQTSPSYLVGVVHELPADYVGERHVAVVRQNANGHAEFEERPGPAPAGQDRHIPWVIVTEDEANI